MRSRETQRTDMENLEREVGEQKLIINMLRSGLESGVSRIRYSIRLHGDPVHSSDFVLGHFCQEWI